MNWYPNKRLGLLWGLGLVVALLCAGYLFLRWTVQAPVGPVLFGRALLLLATLPLIALSAYAWYGLANLTYRIERNGIVVRWAAGYDVVPMADIEEIVPFGSLGSELSGGIGWPGYRIGLGRIGSGERVRLYLAGQPEHWLLVRTAERSYLLSPADVDGFLADYRSRRMLRPIVHWTQGRRLPAPLSLSIWRDRPAAALILPGLALDLGLFGYLASRYPHLPARLILSLDPQGLGDRIGARSELFLLPAIGLGILLLNTVLAAWVHRRERLLALLLVCVVPVVQTLVWLAAVRLVS